MHRRVPLEMVPRMEPGLGVTAERLGCIGNYRCALPSWGYLLGFSDKRICSKGLGRNGGICLRLLYALTVSQISCVGNTHRDDGFSCCIVRALYTCATDTLHFRLLQNPLEYFNAGGLTSEARANVRFISVFQAFGYAKERERFMFN